MEKGQALINGKLLSSTNVIEITSPNTLEVIGSVPALSLENINDAFLAAKNVQKQWEGLLINERIKFIEQWKQLIIENTDVLANLMVLEIAKGKKAAISEINRTIEYIDFTVNEAYRIYPESYTGDAFNVKNKLAIFSRVAKGVVLAISPFNYPVNLSLAKIIPALIMGNTVVFKPASQSSLTGLFLAKLAFDANFPAGVINAVTGKGSVIGDSLVTNPAINVISFTGSDVTGKHITKITNKVDIILELGGKDPAIVLKDCDLVMTAKKIVKGAFSYSGQRCTAIKRVLVDNTIADELVSLIKVETEKLTVGSPNDNADITPIIDMKTSDILQKLVDDALEKKASLVLGNTRKNNLWYPTIIDNVTKDMDIAWIEPFGPVLPIIRVTSIDEAITLANGSKYGLQASIFTNDIDMAVKIANQLDVGSININDAPQRGPDYLPFLGIKDSGMGVQGIREALLSMTRHKGIVFNWKADK